MSGFISKENEERVGKRVYLAEERVYTFSNVAANALGDVRLILDLKGDFNSNGAFIEIFDEGDQLIGSTTQGVASCDNAGQVTFTLAASDFNAMAADGIFQIKIVPFQLSKSTLPPQLKP